MVTFARRWRLSDLRIRTKLTLILVLPLLAIVTLAGLSVVSATSASTASEQARQLVVLGTRAAELTERLQGERAAAVLVFAAGTDAAAVDDYRQRADASDEAIERFRDQRRRGTPPEPFRSSLSRVDSGFWDLRAVRRQVLSAPEALASVAMFRYRVIIDDLLRFRELLSQVDATTEIAGRLRATAALGNAAEALGVVQTTVVRSLAAGWITPAAQGGIAAADADFTGAIAEFRSLAPAAWVSRYNRVMAGPEVLAAERLHGIVVRAQPGPLPALGVDASGWVAAVRTRIRLLHTLESELDSHLVAEIERQRDAARRSIAATAGGVGAAILGMIVLGAIVARSLTRSLTGLRATAEAIAHTRLPEMVAQVSAGAVDLDRTRRLITEIARPVPVTGQDEVGQVAAAFNAVTASAVRLAGEQAALRGGVRAIFNSLSRRSQRRLSTVMTSIDSLQAKETDPDQLAQWFLLDQAGTGLRRLTAGLLVLGGGRAGLARPRPMVLADVLRAAQSEIDQYQRVDIGAVDDDVELHGETVEEIIHLLAELLDNAARFSAPDTLVVVDGRRVGDRVHIQITDDGKGMTEDQLAAARDRIASPHRLDHHAAQQMGLPVVSAIADRLGISVELRPAEPQGTRVDLTLPPALFRTVLAEPAAVSESTAFAETAVSESTATAQVPPEAEIADLPELGSGWPSAPSWPSPTPAARPAMSQPAQPVARPAMSQPAQPVAAPPGSPAHPEPAPEIYRQLKRAWFGGRPAPQGGATPHAAGEAPEPTALTVTGLPRRRPGIATPPVADAVAGPTDASAAPPAPQWPPQGPPAVAEPAPAPAGQRRHRDSDQLRRRYAGLERGLMAVRRRSAPSLPPEEQQP